MPDLKQPLKEEKGGGKMRVAYKKTKIKTEEDETVKAMETKSAGRKKAKVSVQNDMTHTNTLHTQGLGLQHDTSCTNFVQLHLKKLTLIKHIKDLLVGNI